MQLRNGVAHSYSATKLPRHQARKSRSRSHPTPQHSGEQPLPPGYAPLGAELQRWDGRLQRGEHARSNEAGGHTGRALECRSDSSGLFDKLKKQNSCQLGLVKAQERELEYSESPLTPLVWRLRAEGESRYVDTIGNHDFLVCR